MQTENNSETYDFNQAMEGLAHGLFVARISGGVRHTFIDPKQSLIAIDLDDFYANDWVDVSDLVKSD